MYRDYVKWRSASLGRKMELLWFGTFGRPVLMFPTANGRFFEYEDTGLAGSLADKVDRGDIQLVLVDSINQESWYSRALTPAERVARHGDYDAYLRNELAPYVFNRAQRGDLTVFGGDFGAYHAANFTARYPDLVARAILFSGIYDIHCFIDGYWDEDCYFHCPTAYIPNMSGEWVNKLRHVEWVVATGEYDPVVEKSRGFSEVLASKGFANRFDLWPGTFGHDWGSWRRHLRAFV